MAENTVHIDQPIRAVLGSNRAAPTVRCWLVVLTLTLLAESGCWNGPAKPVESPRLHTVAVLYGKYLAAHEGEMPSDKEEFVQFIESHESETLQRYSYKSGEELVTAATNEPQIMVLYRDQRERLHTDFVAIEEQQIQGREIEKKSRSRWFAVDPLVAAQEIDEQQAKRVLAEAG